MKVTADTDVRGWVIAALRTRADLFPGTVQVVGTPRGIKLYLPGENQPFAIIHVERV
jgi:hypothetical protein